jgi:ketosteroid isomerase-like protein
MSTRSVVEHHLQAFGDGDVDATLADYTEESILITQRGVVRGMSALRAVFEELYSGLFKPGTFEFTVDGLEVEGELAHLVWHMTGEAADIPFATDTYVVRDGKIAGQTFAGQINPK